jgi:hypothetical protein
MPWQIRRRIVIVAIFGIAALVAVEHLTAQSPLPPWVSSTALGDVAVSFDASVDIRDNANAGLHDESLTLTGPNGGLIYDDSLNLVVANTAVDQIVKFAPGGTTPRPFVTVPTQDAPRALAIAKDGTIYVASAGSPATIRRIPGGATTCDEDNPCPEFTVPTASNLCIGIDLDDQNTMYFVSGGRTVNKVVNANTATGTLDALSTPVFANLNGSGTACGLRMLAPVDARDITPLPAQNAPPTAIAGLVVADGSNIRLVTQSGQSTLNPGSGNKNWVDVAVDSTGAVWAVNAGNSNNFLARVRFGSQAPAFTVGLNTAPRGVAVNGELRYAQTIRNLQLTATQESPEAEFLTDLTWEHAWRGNFSKNGSIAVQAIEVRPELKNDEQATNNICPPSLYIDCRLSLFNPFRLAISPVRSAVPKTYTHNRSVFYREILRSSALATATAAIGIRFSPDINTTDESAGQVCTVGGTPRKASAIVRDPWPHTLFSYDPTFVFYGGDDVVRTKSSTTNDSIMVERDALYFMRIIKPDDNSSINFGSTKQIAVEVRRPSDCSFVTGLESRLVLAITDITNGIDTLVGDSIGAYGTLASNGLSWASVASQYRTNVPFTTPKFQNNRTYRLCVAAGAAANAQETSNVEPAKPLASEACIDVTTN